MTVVNESVVPSNTVSKEKMSELERTFSQDSFEAVPAYTPKRAVQVKQKDYAKAFADIQSQIGLGGAPVVPSFVKNMNDNIKTGKPLPTSSRKFSSSSTASTSSSSSSSSASPPKYSVSKISSGVVEGESKEMAFARLSECYGLGAFGGQHMLPAPVAPAKKPKQPKSPSSENSSFFGKVFKRRSE